MRQVILAFILSFTSIAVHGQDNLYDLFKMAIQNESMSPNYIVITVTNTQTGDTKEIATLAPFLEGAIHRELDIGYSMPESEKVKKFALEQKDRYFEFKKKEALENIGFFDYPSKETVDSFASNIDMEDFENYKSNDGHGIMSFGSERKNEQLLFAHIMFKNGILTGIMDVTGQLYFGDINKIYKRE